jgi:hypothetical protein
LATETHGSSTKEVGMVTIIDMEDIAGNMKDKNFMQKQQTIYLHLTSSLQLKVNIKKLSPFSFGNSKLHRGFREAESQPILGKCQN